MDKVAKPRSRMKIRSVTTIIRELCDLNNTHQFPVLIFLENFLTEIFDDFEYEILEDHELDCEARTYPSLNRIEIRRSVYEGAYDENYRDLFTIAHEIGHLFLHRDSSISFARDSKKEIKKFEDPEWQANTFAGELLAPPHLLYNLSTDEISQKCKVSRKTAEIQKSFCN